MLDIVVLRALDRLNKFIARIDDPSDGFAAVESFIREFDRLILSTNKTVDDFVIIRDNEVQNHSTQMDASGSAQKEIKSKLNQIVDLTQKIEILQKKLGIDPKHRPHNGISPTTREFADSFKKHLVKTGIAAHHFVLVETNSSFKKLKEIDSEITRLKKEFETLNDDLIEGYGKARKKIKITKVRQKKSTAKTRRPNTKQHNDGEAPPNRSQKSKKIVTGAKLFGRHTRRRLDEFCADLSALTEPYSNGLELGSLIDKEKLDEILTSDPQYFSLVPKLPVEFSVKIGDLFTNLAKEVDLQKGAISNAQRMFIAVARNMPHSDNDELKVSKSDSGSGIINNFDATVGKRWWKAPHKMYDWVVLSLVSGVTQEIIRTKIVASDEIVRIDISP